MISFIFQSSTRSMSCPKKIRIIGDDSSVLKSVNNALMKLLQKAWVVDIDLIVLSSSGIWIHDVAYVDLVSFKNGFISGDTSNVVNVNSYSNLQDACKAALQMAGIELDVDRSPTIETKEDIKTGNKPYLFDEAILKQKRVGRIEQFIRANLEAQKLTVQNNLIDDGYHTIVDKSIDDIRTERKQAIITWFEKNGALKNQILIDNVHDGWIIRLGERRQVIQHFPECPPEWDDDKYAVFCTTFDWRSVSRVKNGDKIDLERFVTTKQVDKLRELSNDSGYDSKTHDFYVMIDKALLTFE